MFLFPFFLKIFNEKVEFDAGPKVDALNPNYKKQGGNAQIFNEKVEFDAAAKVDALNPNYKKQGGNVKVRLGLRLLFFTYLKIMP